MTSHAMSQVRNFRACGAGVPRSLEIDAVIETITEGWDYVAVFQTAERGVSDADRFSIREIIAEEALSVSAEEAEAALLEWAKFGVEHIYLPH